MFVTTENQSETAVDKILTELNMELNTSLTVAKGRTRGTRRANAYNVRDDIAVVGVTSYNTVEMEGFPVWDSKVQLLRQAVQVYETVWYVVAHSNQDGTVIGVQYIPAHVLLDYLDNGKQFFVEREGSDDMASAFLPTRRPGGFYGVGVDALHQFTEVRHPADLPYMEAKWQEVVSHYNLSQVKVTKSAPELPNTTVEQEVVEEVQAAVVVTEVEQVTPRMSRRQKANAGRKLVADNGSTWNSDMRCYVGADGFRDYDVDPQTGEVTGEDW